MVNAVFALLMTLFALAIGARLQFLWMRRYPIVVIHETEVPARYVLADELQAFSAIAAEAISRGMKLAWAEYEFDGVPEMVGVFYTEAKQFGRVTQTVIQYYRIGIGKVAPEIKLLEPVYNPTPSIVSRNEPPPHDEEWIGGSMW